ncbi:MAG: thymidine kinase [Bacillota bacterium]
MANGVKAGGKRGKPVKAVLQRRKEAGYLEIVCGSMFSGKSEELIRRAKRVAIARKRVVVCKPAIDTRYGHRRVSSHDGNSLRAHPINQSHPEDVLDLAAAAAADVIAIDEAQFFGPEIVEVVQRLVQAGRRVIVAGLDMDFAGRPFGSMPVLMALADEVTKLKAICVKCGEPACFNQRLINGRPAAIDDPIIVIGGKESYEARCRRCHEVARK